ncbi:MAG TPA: isochorismatase family protein [Burkholderiaceae bacterium]|nr:isochorismatase family protein [Burkholderiaceae bacterium]
MRLRSEQSFLLVVDVQAQLAPRVEGGDQIIARCAALIQAARLLKLPVRITEHCADRIGHSVPEILALTRPDEVVSKTHFCCTDEPGAMTNFDALDRKQAVIAGMEAHVCAMQAALGLADHGYECFFVYDASGSRRSSDHMVAIERLRMSNVHIVTAEMVMFEWLKCADAPEFRELLKIVKSV